MRAVYFFVRDERLARGLPIADGTRDPRWGGRPLNGLNRGTAFYTSPSCTIVTVARIVRRVVAARWRSFRASPQALRVSRAPQRSTTGPERQRLVFLCLFF